MALEDELKQIERLESIEKVFKEIELKKYESLIKEKLPKAIENVLAMKDYILKIKYELQLKGPICLDTDYEKGSITIGHCMNRIKFIFKEEKLKNISYEINYQKDTGRDIKHLTKEIIREKNSVEFTKRISDFCLGGKIKEENAKLDLAKCIDLLKGDCIDLEIEEFISAMNKVPERLKEYYSKNNKRIKYNTNQDCEINYN